MRLGRKSPDDVVLNNMPSRSHAQYMSTVVCGDLPKALSTQGKRGWATIFSLQNKSGVTKPFAAQSAGRISWKMRWKKDPQIFWRTSKNDYISGHIIILIREGRVCVRV
ncbi:uncharacterized protein LOC120704598 [Panicum virgatum]|uniref:uncharacterized protein LOC120704598 n=1 Tax=Panicum virgatum TaxID=38727 RepID=UPI0019D5C2F4|nr:uncharacterized protein LOC120704598 [Panicum virgatum]